MKLIPNLHTMTEYSFLESTIKIDDLIFWAKTNGLKELVITDHNNMHGVAEFVSKCQKNNIKPILGVDLDVENFRLVLLAKNYDGFLHIINLVSQKNFHKDITRSEIDDRNIYIIDHPEYGFFKKTKEQLHFNNYFVANEESLVNSLPISYVRFLRQKDKSSLVLAESLRQSKKVANIVGTSFSSYELKNDEQINRVQKIINSINLVFPKIVNPIPKYDDFQNSNLLFKKIIHENAKLILQDKLEDPTYFNRIKYEVEVIQKLNFEDYFLIIWDLIKWAKNNKIIIGPGRGSSAGSLISYILNITEIDPIKYDLIFERFLNPERITMPDIDIDIQDDRRDEVVQYLFTKYGSQKVGYISTFQKLAAKGSLRDVGKILGFSVGDIINISKTIPNFATLQEAYNSSIRFKAFIDKNDENTVLFNEAKKIEGLPKNLGTHAAGIVISDKPLVFTVPILKSSEGYTQVQYSMSFLEENGLLKIDLLGLKNLTIINDIQKEIFKNHNKKIILEKIPTNDPKTNKLLSAGTTNGIFQLESFGMKRTLKQVGVSSVDDLATIISLFRPGPMEYIKHYADVKKNKVAIKKVYPAYDAIVNSTNGIIVYQEQIMKIVQVYAGMSFGKADIIRRAISKKKISLMKKFKKEFIKCSVENDHSQEQAERIYGLIEKFADYGFNKSHAVAYAVLAYRMAYLKAQFPFEFYTSLIKFSIGSVKTLKQYILEAKNSSIQIKPPNINFSEASVINKKPQIILPLLIIKGLGRVANDKILQERKSFGHFLDFFDFVARMKKINITESMIISLIKSNALSDFANMTTLLDSLSQAIRYAQMITTTKNEEKIIDFNMLAKPNLVKLKPSREIEMKNEYEILGFNLTAFKTSPFESSNNLLSLKIDDQKEVVFEILNIKRITDKNGNQMAILNVLDSTKEIELFIFNSIYKLLPNFKKGMIVKGEIRKNENGYVLRKVWKEITEWKN